MKLLLIEDDAETGAYLERGLRNLGHTVDLSTNGRDGLFMGTSGAYEAVIVDRMLPGMDGLSVVKALRAAGSAAPVLFLTAIDGVQDRVEGLEAGADDYLVKPFAFSELVARLHAITRRPAHLEAGSKLRVADLEVDTSKRTVSRAGQRIDLQAQEYKLLEYLVQHAGQVVTRNMLLENVWSFHFDPRTNIIESHMSRLRAKVDRGFGADLIQTVRGSGYRIDAPA